MAVLNWCLILVLLLLHLHLLLHQLVVMQLVASCAKFGQLLLVEHDLAVKNWSD